MGSRGAFLPQGGFSEPLKYQEIGKIEGVKVLRDPTAQKQSLPQRAIRRALTLASIVAVT